MRLPVKLVDESLGADSINTGGRLSLGPPVGGIMLAQPVELEMNIIAIKNIERESRLVLVFFITVTVLCKLTSIICYVGCISSILGKHKVSER